MTVGVTFSEDVQARRSPRQVKLERETQRKDISNEERGVGFRMLDEF